METSSGNVVQLAGARDALQSHAAPRLAGSTRDFCIDGWLVQPLLNRLTRKDITVRVRPQLMDLLVCLASHPGTVLSRDQLVASVWEGRWVTESAVSRCVAELRAALADSVQRPRIIETISKRGYRLIAQVEPVPSAGSVVPAASVEVAETAEPDGAPRSVRRWLAWVARRWTSTAQRP